MSSYGDLTPDAAAVGADCKPIEWPAIIIIIVTVIVVLCHRILSIPTRTVRDDILIMYVRPQCIPTLHTHTQRGMHIPKSYHLPNMYIILICIQNLYSFSMAAAPACHRSWMLSLNPLQIMVSQHCVCGYGSTTSSG